MFSASSANKNKSVQMSCNCVVEDKSVVQRVAGLKDTSMARQGVKGVGMPPGNIREFSCTQPNTESNMGYGRGYGTKTRTRG